MATANLANTSSFAIDTNKDSIVIQLVLDSIPGGRTLDVTGFAPTIINAGHPIIVETSSQEYKPMPATPASTGNIATLGSVTAGSGYTNGTYENVPLTGGTGTGAKATVVIASTVLSTVTMTTAGKDYTVADALSFDASTVGGTGTGASVPVATVGVTASTFGTLPSGHTYAGISINTVLTRDPRVGIMINGRVNHLAMPYTVTSILAALKTALPRVDFRAD